MHELSQGMCPGLLGGKTALPDTTLHAKNAYFLCKEHLGANINFCIVLFSFKINIMTGFGVFYFYLNFYIMNIID